VLLVYIGPDGRERSKGVWKLQALIPRQHGNQDGNIMITHPSDDEEALFVTFLPWYERRRLMEMERPRSPTGRGDCSFSRRSHPSFTLA
jgi:hypothetical protein